MILKKLFLIFLVLLILYLIFKNTENFIFYSHQLKGKQGHTMRLFGKYDKNVGKVDKSSIENENKNLDSANMDISETHIKTDDMNIKAKINQSMINLDPNTGDNKNINVGNDIIVNKRFRIAGYPYDIDIPLLRYIKYIPLHFEEEICLRDWQGSDCINKKHVEVVKGDRKINLKTYPENKRMCLGAVDILHKKHLYQGPSSNKVFTSKNCKNGDLGIQFEIVREPHNHYGDDTHYHNHAIKDVSHNNIL